MGPLYEPGNGNKGDKSLDLLSKILPWAKMVNPWSAGKHWIVGLEPRELHAFQAAHSDVITYHDYEAPELHERVIKVLKTNGKPLICTEYMARTRNSTFENTMPILRKENVGR